MSESGHDWRQLTGTKPLMWGCIKCMNSIESEERPDRNVKRKVKFTVDGLIMTTEPMACEEITVYKIQES